MKSRRELRIVAVGSGEVLKTFDVSQFSEIDIYRLECRLRQEIDEDEYRLVDTGARKVGSGSLLSEAD